MILTMLASDRSTVTPLSFAAASRCDHDLMHQMFDHLLSDEPILLARHFCDCLRDRVDHFIRFRGIDFA